jgi:hypothetical protein
MAKPSARTRSKSGRSGSIRSCRMRARLCNTAITRSAGAGFLRSCLLAQAGRDRLEAGRCALRPRQSRPVAQGQTQNREEFVGWAGPIPKAPRPCRSAVARLLRPGWLAGLCPPRRYNADLERLSCRLAGGGRYAARSTAAPARAGSVRRSS